MKSEVNSYYSNLNSGQNELQTLQSSSRYIPSSAFIYQKLQQHCELADGS